VHNRDLSRYYGIYRIDGPEDGNWVSVTNIAAPFDPLALLSHVAILYLAKHS
jgi:hypothetical protein